MGIRSTLHRLKRDRLGLHGRTPCAAKFPHLYLVSLGLVCIVERSWCLHLLVRREDWLWGSGSGLGGLSDHVGAGPLFLFIRDRVPPIDSATSERTLNG